MSISERAYGPEKIAALLAFFYVAFFMGGIFLYYLKTGSTQTLQVSLTRPGTWIAATTALLIGWGLWNRYKWAWWAGLFAAVIRVFQSAATAWDMASGNDFQPSIDWPVFFILFLSIVFLIILVMPQTRHACGVAEFANPMVAPSERTFRFMVVAMVMFGLAAGLADIGFSSLVPASAQAVRAELMNASISYVRDLVGVALVFLVFVVAGGLYFFKAWARVANWVLMLAGAIYEVSWQYSVWSGWTNAMNNIHLLLWGATVALSYSPAISHRFQPKEAAT